MLPLHNSHVLDIEQGGSLKGEHKPAMQLTHKIKQWVRTILSQEDSRNLFFFLLLNMVFAGVELVFGMWSNSLGLISDAFHMVFDCTALLAGMVAVVITKWAPNERFTFGYVRAEVIAGFVNSLFLLFVAFFIFAEAVERAFEPPEVKHDRLMLISILGFIVNLVGIFVFHHGGGGHHHHGHSHHGDHHHHDHHHHEGSNHHHGHNHHDNHVHSGHHHHGGHSQIIHGVFLHILADTLGSVGVIISSFLIGQFGWMLADPVCSMAITVLIVSSVYPLMKDSLGTLMMRTPPTVEHYLPGAYQKISQLPGVVNMRDAHVWSLCTGVHHASLHLEVLPDCDSQSVLNAARNTLKQVGVGSTTIEMTHYVS